MPARWSTASPRRRSIWPATKARARRRDAPGGAFVVADSARIDQILTNLVVNSIRYTEAGHVRLALQPYSAEKRLLEFIVSDTGPGIPAAMLPTLLAPDRTTTGPERRGEGSGMGLAIVRTLVDHLGGSVAVASSLGRGTTFTVDIPAEPVRRRHTIAPPLQETPCPPAAMTPTDSPTGSMPASTRSSRS